MSLRPKLNGLKTCKKIRLEWEQLTCPILFFTSQASSETIRDIRQMGGDDYINKSLPPNVLAERVLHWAEKTHQAAQ
ncbi:response regulator [Terasakiella sp. SH-1]|uniref:response regulator n=1 Tax=Terasakiella sp. SH-1 TaxID=2560057 RepID=UPI001073B0DD|nr:response regulator [Terasakiella sp. SH-1]